MIGALVLILRLDQVNGHLPSMCSSVVHRSEYQIYLIREKTELSPTVLTPNTARAYLLATSDNPVISRPFHLNLGVGNPVDYLTVIRLFSKHRDMFISNEVHKQSFVTPVF
jgi:hypothetical protein